MLNGSHLGYEKLPTPTTTDSFTAQKRLITRLGM